MIKVSGLEEDTIEKLKKIKPMTLSTTPSAKAQVVMHDDKLYVRVDDGGSGPAHLTEQGFQNLCRYIRSMPDEVVELLTSDVCFISPRAAEMAPT